MVTAWVIGPTPPLPDRFARMLLVEKWATLPSVLAGRQFDRTSELWQQFTTLVKLRNAITHFEWRWHVDEVPALMKVLVCRDLVIPGAAGIYWFDAVLTNRIAIWAVKRSS